MATIHPTISETFSEYFPEGIDYIVSEEKAEFDARLANRILPIVKAGLVMTELAVHGSLGASNYSTEERMGQYGKPFAVPKLRLTEPSPEGADASRLLNKRAFIAKVTGLDELPQWKLVASGEMSVVGPRPLLQESIDLFSTQAEKAGVTSEEIEDWRMFLRISRPGLFGKSQALRHKRNFDESTPASSAKIIAADLEYMRTASPSVDRRTIAASLATIVYEGIRSIR